MIDNYQACSLSVLVLAQFSYLFPIFSVLGSLGVIHIRCLKRMEVEDFLENGQVDKCQY